MVTHFQTLNVCLGNVQSQAGDTDSEFGFIRPQVSFFVANEVMIYGLYHHMFPQNLLKIN